MTLLERVKEWARFAGLAVIAVLGILLFRRGKQVEQAQSELAKEKSNTEIKLNDQAREAARANADALVDEYHKLRGDDR